MAREGLFGDEGYEFEIEESQEHLDGWAEGVEEALTRIRRKFVAIKDYKAVDIVDAELSYYFRKIKDGE